MKTIIPLLLALVGLLFAPGAGAQTLTPLKPGDPISVELKVPAEDALNVTAMYSISGAGTLRLPYLDREIAAAGLTTTDLARRIEQAYRAAEIYTNPTINCTTQRPENYQPHIVTVGGEVKSGGREVPLRDGMRLYQAIMSAGGFTEFADVKRVKIIRGTRAMVYDMRKIDERGSNNPILLDGDTIHVPQD
jgi:protein involved in polysaccharide export with SLBB domain